MKVAGAGTPAYAVAVIVRAGGRPAQLRPQEAVSTAWQFL